MKKNLLILGAGGHGKVIADIAKLDNVWNEIAFLDDNVELKEVNGIKVLDKIQHISEYRDRYNFAFVAIGDNKRRSIYLKKIIELGYEIPVLVHPFTSISENTFIERGTVIMPGVVLNTNTKIGLGCIINTTSSIDHDCFLENFVHISPGVRIGGNSRIGEFTWIGIGTSIINNVSIGKNVIVAAGSVVLNNVPDNVMVAGVPAVVKKILNEKNIDFSK